MNVPELRQRLKRARDALETQHRRLLETTQAPGRGHVGLGPLILTQDRAPDALGSPEELLDDTAWLTWRERVARGDFNVAAIEIPATTYGPEWRSAAHPGGWRRRNGRPLLPEQVALLRTETQLSRRAAHVATEMDRLRRPWAVWVRLHAEDGILPVDREEWMHARIKCARASGPGWAAWGNGAGIQAWLTACGPEGPIGPAARATLPAPQPPDPPPRPAGPRLVRAAPHTLAPAADADLHGPEDGPPGTERARTAADDPDRAPSTRERREEENARYPGGLRNPWRACRLYPGLRAIGRRARALIEAFIDEHPEVLGLYEDLGRDQCCADKAGHACEVADCPSWHADPANAGKRPPCTGTDEALLEILRERLAELVGALGWGPVDKPGEGIRSRFRPDLMEAYSAAASDPERCIFEWLRDGAPIGLTRPLPETGLFPPVDGVRRARDEFEDLTAQVDAAQFSNYLSFAENIALAVEEVDRVTAAGHMRRFKTLAEVEAYVGGAPLLNRLALQVKEKADGTVKLRLITDLLRSEGNSFLHAPERIVLPRLEDAIEMGLWLLDAVEASIAAGGPSDDGVEWGSTDVKDAFFNVPVWPADRRVQCYKIREGDYAVSDSLVFGAGPSPLIWGYVAAWLARVAQGLFDFRELLLQLYVDDPLWAVRGTPAERRRRTVVLLLFWQAFGVPFSWVKSQIGEVVQWIGARLLAVNRGPRGRGIEVTVPADKGAALQEEIGRLSGGTVVPRRPLRQFAGRASFVAGLIPHLRPFLSGVWAALRAPFRPGADLVAARQLAHSFAWIRAFLDGTAGAPLRRQCYLRDSKFAGRYSVAVDASPWGIGAILIDGTRPVARVDDCVQPDDARRFGLTIGESAGQALLEGLAALVALRVFASWHGWGAGTPAQVTLKSDSKAALGVALKQASPDARLNAVARELAYDQACGDYRVELYEHVAGVANVLPDYLSRLYAPEHHYALVEAAEDRAIPVLLRGVPRVEPPVRDDAWWKTWFHPEGRVPAGPAERN